MVAITVTPLDDIDPAVLARRKALGHDRFDEVWDGVLHMVPPPLSEHCRIGVELIGVLLPLTKVADLEIRYEQGLIPPTEPGYNNYRVPDLTICRPEVETVRGIEGPPELLVEIRSPGDDSYKKLPFYEQMGAAEFLIIHRDTKIVRRWVHGPGGLLEVPMHQGRHWLRCVPLSLHTEDGHLVVESVDGTIRI